MVGIWSVAEPCLGIVAACLPTMVPVVTKVLYQLAKISNGLRYSWTLKRTTHSSSKEATTPIDRAYSDLQPLQNFAAGARMDTYITSGEKSQAFTLGRASSIPLNAIKVNTTTSWTGK